MARTVRSTSPALLNVLVAVRKAGRATSAQLAVNTVYLHRLEKQGLVKTAARVKSDQRGRPAHVYACTDKGRKRADRALSA